MFKHNEIYCYLMIFLMIIKMILHMDDNIDVDRDVTIPNHGFIYFIILQRCFLRDPEVLCLCLMSKMSDVFLYTVPMMFYCQ